MVYAVDAVDAADAVIQLGMNWWGWGVRDAGIRPSGQKWLHIRHTWELDKIHLAISPLISSKFLKVLLYSCLILSKWSSHRSSKDHSHEFSPPAPRRHQTPGTKTLPPFNLIEIEGEPIAIQCCPCLCLILRYLCHGIYAPIYTLSRANQKSKYSSSFIPISCRVSRQVLYQEIVGVSYLNHP